MVAAGELAHLESGDFQWLETACPSGVAAFHDQIEALVLILLYGVPDLALMGTNSQ